MVLLSVGTVMCCHGAVISCHSDVLSSVSLYYIVQCSSAYSLPPMCIPLLLDITVFISLFIASYVYPSITWYYSVHQPIHCLLCVSLYYLILQCSSAYSLPPMCIPLLLDITVFISLFIASYVYPSITWYYSVHQPIHCLLCVSLYYMILQCSSAYSLPPMCIPLLLDITVFISLFIASYVYPSITWYYSVHQPIHCLLCASLYYSVHQPIHCLLCVSLYYLILQCSSAYPLPPMCIPLLLDITVFISLFIASYVYPSITWYYSVHQPIHCLLCVSIYYLIVQCSSAYSLPPMCIYSLLDITVFISLFITSYVYPPITWYYSGHQPIHCLLCVSLYYLILQCSSASSLPPMCIPLLLDITVFISLFIASYVYPSIT